MEKKIFITSTEKRSGKSLITIGLINAFQGMFPRVGYMKPIGQRYDGDGEIDTDATLVKNIFGFEDSPRDINPASMDDATEDKDILFEKIFDAYGRISADRDMVVVEGTDYDSTVTALEFDINAELAKNLNAPVLLIANGSDKTVDEIATNIVEVTESFRDMGCSYLGVILNRLRSKDVERDIDKINRLLAKDDISLFGTILFNPTLSGPRLREVAEKLDATPIFVGDDLNKVVTDVKVLAMTPENALNYLKDQDGCLLITPGDRVEHILTALIAQKSRAYPQFSGLVLTGGLIPGKNVQQLVKGIDKTDLTILSVIDDTYATTLKVNSIAGEITEDDDEKIKLAFRKIERYVDVERINRELGEHITEITTPRMFQYRLIQTAKRQTKHIVLPEGNELRIIQATAEILRRKICDVTLIGDKEKIGACAEDCGADIEGARIIDVSSYDRDVLDDYAETFYQLRKHKGVTREMARDQMLDPVHYATMMVYKNHADGFVSGSTHSTANTLAPVLRIIRAREDVSLASSIFFMCMPDKVLVYGDCALVENPNAEQLADIAITSAETARAFGIPPIVAMLSYSTGESGKGIDVDKVREATKITRSKRPDLLIEGPIQYDAAFSAEVARIKLKDSSVAGKARVYIFPDLDAGNTAYKAVQRSANVPAFGPILQGLNKPANDLSRGADVTDIVYTIAITAIQAQEIAASKPEPVASR
jgi:phosphate acetyltransferase